MSDRRLCYAITALFLMTRTLDLGLVVPCLYAVFYPDDLLDMVSDLSCRVITAEYTAYVRTAGIIGAVLLALIYFHSSDNSGKLSWVHVPVVFLAVAAALSLRSFIVWALGMRD